MSLIKEALADKKEQRRVEERLKREAVEKARADMTFEARLQESLKVIETLMADDAVLRITCEIKENDLAAVTKARFEGKLSEYRSSIVGNVLIFEKEIIDM
jgi:hypothetical protein